MKQKVKLNGKKVIIDLDKPKVKKLVTELVKACLTRTFPIGMVLEHENGVEYQLVSICQHRGGAGRAYLINTDTGRARNSRKVVAVLGDFHSEGGLYTEDLPAERDKFFDPDGNGEFIEITS